MRVALASGGSRRARARGLGEPLRAFVDAAREASDASNAAVRFSGAASGPAALLATNGDATSYSAAAAKVAAAFARAASRTGAR